MKITYKNNKIKKVCTNVSEAEKRHGLEMAEKIMLRIGRCHQLKGNRKNQFAVDLVHPYRLVFEKKGTEIQIANIIEIIDYH